MAGAAEQLLVAPNKLLFSTWAGQAATCVITLKNPSDERIAFKVKTTAPASYSVKPSAGLLEPGHSAELRVNMAPRDAKALAGMVKECKDRFLVEALAVGPQVQQATSELFKTNSKAVSGTKLKVLVVNKKPNGSGSQPAVAAPAAPAKRPTSATATKGAKGSFEAAKQPQQQKREQATPPTAPPAKAAAAPATGLARLPGTSRLAKAAPPPEQAAVPDDVLALFQTAPDGATQAPAEPSLASQPAAASQLEPAGKAAAAPGAAAGAPAAAKFSSSLRNRMAKIQQQQLKAGGHQPEGQGVEQPHEQTVSLMAPPTASTACPAEPPKPPAGQAASVQLAPAQQGEESGAPRDGEQYVGQAVRKKFEGRFFTGSVLRYERDEQWFLVKYEDSDEEHIDFSELQRILVTKPAKKRVAVQGVQKQEVGQPAKPTEQLPGERQGAREAAQGGQSSATAEGGEQREAEGNSLKQQTKQEAGSSPAQSALVSHHTELAPAGGTATAAAAVQDTAATARGSRHMPAATRAPAAAVAGAATTAGAVSKRAGRPSRMSDILVEPPPPLQQQQQPPLLPGQKAGAGHAEGPAAMDVEASRAPALAAAAPNGDTPAQAGSAAAAAPALASAKARRGPSRGKLGAAAGAAPGPTPAVATADRKQQAKQKRRREEEASEEAELAGIPKMEQHSQRKEENVEEDVEDSDAELAGEEESDPDFELDDADLLSEERQEQRWHERQRREMGLLPGGGRGGSRSLSSADEEDDFSPAPAPRSRRRSSAAAAAAAAGVKAPASVAVKVKAEPGVWQQQKQKLEGSSSLVDLVSSSESEGDGPAAASKQQQQRQKRQSQPPRTKAAAGATLPVLRLSFRAASSETGGTARQRLATVKVRSGAELRTVMAEVAARCLVGASVADAELGRLAFHLGRMRLQPGQTVREAGLQSGDCIDVTIT